MRCGFRTVVAATSTEKAREFFNNHYSNLAQLVSIKAGKY